MEVFKPQVLEVFLLGSDRRLAYTVTQFRVAWCVPLENSSRANSKKISDLGAKDSIVVFWVLAYAQLFFSIFIPQNNSGVPFPWSQIWTTTNAHNFFKGPWRSWKTDEAYHWRTHTLKGLIWHKTERNTLWMSGSWGWCKEVKLYC